MTNAIHTKWFIVFKTTSTLFKKVMEVEGSMTKQEAWDIAIQTYGKAVRRICTEQELYGLAVNGLEQEVVPFGTECIYREGHAVTTYPVSNESQYNVSLSNVGNWFEVGVPREKVTLNRLVAQLGCHFEEVGEMVTAIGLPMLGDRLNNLSKEMITTSPDYHHLFNPNTFTKDSLVALADSVADQIVTLVGVAHMLNLDVNKLVTEVNKSNWSKFENGKPVNKGDKIGKGSNYKKPELEDMVDYDYLVKLTEGQNIG